MGEYIIDTDDFMFTPKTIVIIGIGGCVSKSVDDFEKLNCDYINEHYGDLQDVAYQKGFTDGKEIINRGCEGCRYESVMDSICTMCCNNYSNLWEKKQDDKIKVGDEVESDSNRFIVTHIYEAFGYCDGIGEFGCVYKDVLVESLVKTGRHYGIEKILKEMKE